MNATVKFEGGKWRYSMAAPAIALRDFTEAIPDTVPANLRGKLTSLKGALTGTDTTATQAAERGRALHDNGDHHLLHTANATYNDATEDYTANVAESGAAVNATVKFEAGKWRYSMAAPAIALRDFTEAIPDTVPANLRGKLTALKTALT